MDSVQNSSPLYTCLCVMLIIIIVSDASRGCSSEQQSSVCIIDANGLFHYLTDTRSGIIHQSWISRAAMSVLYTSWQASQGQSIDTIGRSASLPYPLPDVDAGTGRAATGTVRSGPGPCCSLTAGAAASGPRRKRMKSRFRMRTAGIVRLTSARFRDAY